MTEEQIEQKAKNVYIRCFDDDFEYSGVLHALEICAKETAAKATKELQEENENLRSIAKYQQSSNMKRGFEIKELKEDNQYARSIIESLLKNTDEYAKIRATEYLYG